MNYINDLSLFYFKVYLPDRPIDFSEEEGYIASFDFEKAKIDIEFYYKEQAERIEFMTLRDEAQLFIYKKGFENR